MTKTFLCLFAFALMVTLSACQQKTAFDAHVFPVGATSWGYAITVEGKPFIRQEYIPGLSGRVPFSSKKDAKKVVNLVIEKLENGQSPTITQEDLTGINFVRSPLQD